MSNTLKTLQELILEGETFTFENFSSSFSKYGTVQTPTQEWTIWRNRVKAFINAKFGEDSVPGKALQEGLEIKLIGCGKINFTNAKTSILSSLKSAKASMSDHVLPEVENVKTNSNGTLLSNKVFIVHGHDETAKNQLEIFLSELGLIPTVLHRQADEGKTIIEKFEKHSDVGYAFILLTPDEISYLATEADTPDVKRTTEMRARPNVIFEFGYFVGKLGRSRVCCLHTGKVSLPSDVSGIIYKSFNQNIEECAYSIIKELKAAGYNVSI